MNQEKPTYPGTRAVRHGILRNDISFRPKLTQLRTGWQKVKAGKMEPADGFFLFAELRTPQHEVTYSQELRRAYDCDIYVIVNAVKMPIKYAGVGQLSIFSNPDRLDQLLTAVVPIPGSGLKDICVIVTAFL